MDFSELAVKRRSVRHFQDKSVSPDIINSILSDSILAPSAGNEQPWRFIYAKKYEKMLQKDSFHIFYHAPVVIYIVGDADVKNLSVDCALAASYLMMSATSNIKAN